MAFFRSGSAEKTAAAEPEVDLELMRRIDARVRKMSDPSRRVEFTSLRGAGRRHRREQVYRVATAMFINGEEAGCRIVDQSFSGFRLIINSDCECPDEFALTIPTLRFIGIVRRIWNNGRETGVSILRWNDAG